MEALRFIDKLSGWLALIGVPLSLILAIVVVCDVIMRYLFNSPTFWAYDISWMLYSANFLLGFAYVLRERAHIRVDVILDLFKPRVKAGIEAFFILTTLLVFCAAMVGFGIGFAFESWKIKEGSMLTMWAPPVYPIKTIIVIAFLVFGLQGIAEFIRTLKIIIGKRG
jgi:TRAP-type mannitol/chloroaromatic compound transport system permease small subunit